MIFCLLAFTFGWLVGRAFRKRRALVSTGMKFTIDLSKPCAKRCIRSMRIDPTGKRWWMCFCQRRKAGTSWAKQRAAAVTKALAMLCGDRLQSSPLQCKVLFGEYALGVRASFVSLDWEVPVGAFCFCGLEIPVSGL